MLACGLRLYLGPSDTVNARGWSVSVLVLGAWGGDTTSPSTTADPSEPTADVAEPTDDIAASQVDCVEFRTIEGLACWGSSAPPIPN